MPSFPVMRGRCARAVSGDRVYAACAHAVPRLARGARRGRIVRGARGIARRAEAVASPPLSPPLNRSVRHRNAEIGSEIFEQRRREAFREDVGELARTGNMQNADVADADLLSHEVDVELNVLRPLVMNWVARHVCGRNIVAEHKRGLGDAVVKLTEQGTKPCALGDCISDASVFSLCA